MASFFEKRASGGRGILKVKMPYNSKKILTFAPEKGE